MHYVTGHQYSIIRVTSEASKVYPKCFKADHTWPPAKEIRGSQECRFSLRNNALESVTRECTLSNRCSSERHYELSRNSHLKTIHVNRKFLISVFTLSKANNTVLIRKPTKPTKIVCNKQIFTITVFVLMRFDCIYICCMMKPYIKGRQWSIYCLLTGL